MTIVFLPGLPAEAAAAPVKTTRATIYLGLIPIAVASIAYAHVLSRCLPRARLASTIWSRPWHYSWVWLGKVPPVLYVAGVSSL